MRVPSGRIRTGATSSRQATGVQMQPTAPRATPAYIPGLTGSALALALFSLIAGGLAFLVMWLLAEGPDTLVDSAILPELRALLAEHGGFRDQSAQRTGFLVWFFSLWGIVGTALLAPHRLRVPPLPAAATLGIRLLRRHALIGGFGLAALWAWEVERAPSLITPLSAWAFAVGVIATVLIGGAARLGQTRLFARAALLILTPVLSVLLLAGLALPANMSFWGGTMVNLAEVHFTLLMGAAERLANGQVPFKDVSPLYGLLPSILASFSERLGAPLDWAGFYRVAQVLQVGMIAALAVALSWMVRRRRASARAWLTVVLLPLLMVLPNVFTANHMIWFPNQTGWRFLPFAAALVAFVALARVGADRRALALGGLTAISLTWNPETAIAAAIGCAVYTATAEPRFRVVTALRLAALFTTGFLAALLLLAILVRGGFGIWPVPDPDQLFGFILRFNQGFGGLRLHDIDALALLIAGHAGFVLIRSALVWRTRPLSPPQQIQFAVAAIITVWFAYYMNRPQTLNLWTHVYFYAVFVSATWDPRRLALIWRRPWPVLQPAQLPAVLLFALLAQGLWTAANHTWQRAVMSATQLSSIAEQVSGVWLRPELAAHLRAQADFVRTHPAREHLVYFTPQSFSVPLLSDTHPAMPVRDPFWEVQTEAELAMMTERLRRGRAPVILFDNIRADPAAPFGAAHAVAFYDRLKNRLGDLYAPAGREAGWEIWTLREDTDGGR